MNWLSRKSTLGQASAMAVLSALSSAVSLFLGLKVALQFAGADLVGAWALVQSVMIVARIVDSGAGINLTRRASLVAGETTDTGLWEIILSGLITTIAPAALIGIVLLYPTHSYLETQFPHMLDANQTMAVIVGSFLFGMFNSAAAALLAVLDGIGYQVQRHLITIASNLTFLIATIVLTPHLGIAGHAIAYVIMSASLAAIALASIFLLGVPGQRASLSSLLSTLRTILPESLALAFTNFARLSFEPVSKFAIAAISGLAGVAMFDIALKLTGQMRVLFQVATQPLLRAGARDGRDLSAEQKQTFATASDLVSRLSLLVLSVLLSAGPVVSLFLFSDITLQFMNYFILLSVAAVINALGMVGYYLTLSGGQTGRYAALTTGMTVCNLAFTALGLALRSVDVVAFGYGATFVLGGVVGLIWWCAQSGTTPSAYLRTFVVPSSLSLAALSALWFAVVSWSAMDFGLIFLIAISCGLGSASLLLAARTVLQSRKPAVSRKARK